jgi:hypothetical protein
VVLFVEARFLITSVNRALLSSRRLSTTPALRTRFLSIQDLRLVRLTSRDTGIAQLSPQVVAKQTGVVAILGLCPGGFKG